MSELAGRYSFMLFSRVHLFFFSISRSRKRKTWLRTFSVVGERSPRFLEVRCGILKVYHVVTFVFWELVFVNLCSISEWWKPWI